MTDGPRPDERTPDGATADGRTVGEAARLTGVTVRTLHHYDHIGLVRPAGRTAAGYRLYTGADLERLHQVLVYRELGFSLEEVGRLMAAPDFDRGAALRDQRELLEAEGARVRSMLAAVDTAIAAHEKGLTMGEQELREVFSDLDPRYQQEAEERWGDTTAWQQSRRRTNGYRKQDWQHIKDEGEEINRRFTEVFTSGRPATSGEAVELAEAHRAHIERWFYDCPAELHRHLGQMYVTDTRFTETYEAYAEGLAAYVRDAIAANADGHRTD